MFTYTVYKTTFIGGQMFLILFESFCTEIITYLLEFVCIARYFMPVYVD